MTDALPLTEQDKADLATLSAEPPAYHPLLRVWREVLAPAAAEATKKVTPQWASRMVGAYNGLTYAAVNALRDRYFGKIAELGAILDEVIAGDDECLTYTTAEEDLEHNSGHYKEVLTRWQLQLLGWEMAWDCADEHAAAELAAISEVHKMFFGDTGITAFLDNINFEFTEDDQAALAAALEEYRAAHTEEGA